MVTIKLLMEQLEAYRKYEHVWTTLRGFLEGYLPEGGGKLFPPLRGTPIERDVIIAVLGEINESALIPLREKIEQIEALEVGSEKGTELPTASGGDTGERVSRSKKGMESALNNLSQGLADNIEMLWNNQRELAAALSEMNETLVNSIEELRNEKRQSSRTPLSPKVG